jgi:hypothetical protein
MAGGEYKYQFSLNNVGQQMGSLYKNVQIAIVESVDDPNSMNRIKARILGPASKGGDDGLTTDQLSWCIPMIPKFFYSTPKVGEAVFIIILSDEKTHADRLYFGPLISQFDKIKYEAINATALNTFTFGLGNPTSSYDTIPPIKGVFPKVDDIAIQGRYNTDIILRENEILLRAGKFTPSQPTNNNPYNFQFNNTTQGYFHVRNNVYLEPPPPKGSERKSGSIANVVANKINLITHENGNPRYNVLDQDDQVTDDELLKIIQTAHQVPYGDILVKYLQLFKKAFLNHVHNAYGQAPPTDLTSNGTLNVQNFREQSDDLERKMLSKNVRIN